MEKTPRRSSPPTGSVVVDPSSQVPAPPAAARSGGSSSARRKAETTLVLQARRVDTLRRQVATRHRAERLGRRRQVVLWACAGAGAVLLGGWLATRLSPASDHDEAPLVLGRSEDESASRLAPPAPVEAGQGSAEVDAGAREGARAARSTAGAHRVGALPAHEAEAADPSDLSAPVSSSRDAVERSPDEPKVVGDWGDGFDSSGSANGQSHGTRGAGRRAPSGTDAVNLDDLPTE